MTKQRITAFIDPIYVKRAKVRGALEGLTISEIVERALDAYAPLIVKSEDQHLNLKFKNGPDIDTLLPEKAPLTRTLGSKKSKAT